MTTTQIMLDLETMGTTPGCAVLSIGAVAFTSDGLLPGIEFYRVISFSSCLRAGLTASAATFTWWTKQNAEARELLFQTFDASVSFDLRSALSDYSDWHGERDGDDPPVWVNGREFDPPVLGAAYNALPLARPWSYKAVRCYRTMKAMCPGLDVLYVPPTIPHHALEDAKAQAAHLVKIMHTLGITL